MDSIISTFHIDWKIIIAQAINFGVVFTVLYVFALKPLNQLMKDRSEKIEKGIADAKENEAILKTSNVEYTEMIAKAKAEVNALSKEGKKEMEAKKALMIEEANATVATVVAAGKKTLEAEKVKMVEEAKNEIASLAMLATEKLISSKKDLENLS